MGFPLGWTELSDSAIDLLVGASFAALPSVELASRKKVVDDAERAGLVLVDPAVLEQRSSGVNSEQRRR
jgi:hypothetical protein